MIINQFTITGADDSINPNDLLELSKKYKYVEWGILLSKNSVGRNRFPSKEWMEKLYEISDNLNLSGHLCGSWIRNLMAHGDMSFIQDVPLWDRFKRVQLNFHAEPMNLSLQALAALRTQTWVNGKKIIVQMDDVNNKVYEQLLFGGVLAEPLYDVSHGAGVTPDEWPDLIPSVNPHAYRGLAGGLGPHNLEQELLKMEKTVGDDTIWIDLETHARSNDDRQFDLGKVEKCLQMAQKYVKISI